MTIAPPKTITQLRNRLPGWKITYTTEECWEYITQRPRRIVMHVIVALPHGFSSLLPWDGVPYVEASTRTKAEACAVVFLGVRGLEDIWASE